MNRITWAFVRLLISVLSVVMLFATASAANAQSRIGTANSVKPEASGSIAGTLSVGSGVHANETVRTGSSGQAGLRFIDESNLTGTVVTGQARQVCA